MRGGEGPFADPGAEAFLTLRLRGLLESGAFRCGQTNLERALLTAALVGGEGGAATYVHGGILARRATFRGAETFPRFLLRLHLSGVR